MNEDPEPDEVPGWWIATSTLLGLLVIIATLLLVWAGK